MVIFVDNGLSLRKLDDWKLLRVGGCACSLPLVEDLAFC